MRIALDSAAGGGLLHHEYDTTVEIVKMMASNSYAYSIPSTTKIKGKESIMSIDPKPSSTPISAGTTSLETSINNLTESLQGYMMGNTYSQCNYCDYDYQGDHCDCEASIKDNNKVNVNFVAAYRN